MLVILRKRGSIILAMAQGSRINFDYFNRCPRTVISIRNVPTVFSVVENTKLFFIFRSTCYGCVCCSRIYCSEAGMISSETLTFDEVIRVN